MRCWSSAAAGLARARPPPGRHRRPLRGPSRRCGDHHRDPRCRLLRRLLHGQSRWLPPNACWRGVTAIFTDRPDLWRPARRADCFTKTYTSAIVFTSCLMASVMFRANLCSGYPNNRPGGIQHEDPTASSPPSPLATSCSRLRPSQHAGHRPAPGQSGSAASTRASPPANSTPAKPPVWNAASIASTTWKPAPSPTASSPSGERAKHPRRAGSPEQAHLPPEARPPRDAR